MEVTKIIVLNRLCEFKETILNIIKITILIFRKKLLYKITKNKWAIGNWHSDQCVIRFEKALSYINKKKLAHEFSAGHYSPAF